MPGPQPLHYRPLIFYPVGEESILPYGLFAPPPASASNPPAQTERTSQ